MSNLPKQNPHRNQPGKTIVSRPVEQSAPDSVPAQRTKVSNPTWSRNPDSTETYNSSRTANPSMPWSEPEIDEVSPYGPGDDFIADDQ